MLLRHVWCYVEAAGIVLGVDKRKIGNKELWKEKIYSKDLVDVDDLLSKGYTEEIIAAVLGQDLAERCFSSYFSLSEDIREHKVEGDIRKYLDRTIDFLIFKEIIGARIFFLSYSYSEKYSLSFTDMLKAFLDYVDNDLNKYKKLTSCSIEERNAIDRFIENGGNPLLALEHEAEHLWNDMLPSFKYSLAHDIPTYVFAFEKKTIEEGIAGMFLPSQEIIRDKTYLYKELPKRCFLERLDITKGDTIDTPYEYLFNETMDELLTYDIPTDFDWKWQA